MYETNIISKAKRVLGRQGGSPRRRAQGRGIQYVGCQGPVKGNAWPQLTYCGVHGYGGFPGHGNWRLGVLPPGDKHSGGPRVGLGLTRLHGDVNQTSRARQAPQCLHNQPPQGITTPPPLRPRTGSRRKMLCTDLIHLQKKHWCLHS